jgi:hypothetical protein
VSHQGVAGRLRHRRTAADQDAGVYAFTAAWPRPSMAARTQVARMQAATRRMAGRPREGRRRRRQRLRGRSRVEGPFAAPVVPDTPVCTASSLLCTMETLPREELERLVFFESAREQAEKEWSQNPRDTQVWRSHDSVAAGQRTCFDPWLWQWNGVWLFAVNHASL